MVSGAALVAGLCSCTADSRGGAGGGAAAEAARDGGRGELKAGELPEWWVAEPRAVGSVVTVSASGTAPEASVARDLAIRNARAAGRAVLGVEPVRVVVTRETATHARQGEYEAFVLARCDGAGAAALPVGGERAVVAPTGAGSAKGAAKADQPAAEAAPAATPAPAQAAPAAPAPSERAAAAGAPDAPVWWFEEIRRDGTSVRACAKAEGTALVDTRRAAVEAVKKRLTEQGVTGAVQTLFIATRKPEGVGYRVYVMGQGEGGVPGSR